MIYYFVTFDTSSIFCKILLRFAETCYSVAKSFRDLRKLVAALQKPSAICGVMSQYCDVSAPIVGVMSQYCDVSAPIVGRMSQYRDVSASIVERTSQYCDVLEQMWGREMQAWK